MEKSANLVKTETVTFKQGLRLESGRILGPITIAFERYGRLNAEKSNVILVTHAWTGDAHAAGWNSTEDVKPGWWDDMIGPDKPLDTNRFHIICSNVIGSCKGSTGPTSINPQTNRPYSLSFPIVMVQDMVHAQKLLIDHLEIPSLLAVIGGSMGAMQALEWGILYPEIPKAVIPIAGTARTPPMAIALNGLARQAIYNDPMWKKGNYKPEHPPVEGLALARAVGHISFLSSASMEIKFGRRYSVKDGMFDFFGKFEVERYLDYNGSTFVKRFDTNSFLYLAKALDLFDASWNFDSLEDAFARIQCASLWFAFSSDWLYPPEQTVETVEILHKLGKPVEYHLIESEYGHDSFLVEPEKFTPILRQFLDRIIN